MAAIRDFVRSGTLLVHLHAVQLQLSSWKDSTVSSAHIRVRSSKPEIRAQELQKVNSIVSSYVQEYYMYGVLNAYCAPLS